MDLCAEVTIGHTLENLSLHIESGLPVKSLFSGENNPTTAPSLDSEVIATYRAGTADQRKATVLWESILCADPRKPSAIKMILRKFGCLGLTQKIVSCPELTQQALQHPDLSQSSVKHVEASANASQVSGYLCCPLTWERLKNSHPVNQEVSQLKRPQLSSPELNLCSMWRPGPRLSGVCVPFLEAAEGQSRSGTEKVRGLD